LAADELRAERRALDARAKECDRMAADYEQRAAALVEREREAKAERAAADEWRREMERANEAMRAQSAAFDAGASGERRSCQSRHAWFCGLLFVIVFDWLRSLVLDEENAGSILSLSCVLAVLEPSRTRSLDFVICSTHYHTHPSSFIRVSIHPSHTRIIPPRAECGQARDRILAHETAIADRIRAIDAQQQAITQVKSHPRNTWTPSIMINFHHSPFSGIVCITDICVLTV
jgi:hypothetical protein